MNSTELAFSANSGHYNYDATMTYRDGIALSLIVTWFVTLVMIMNTYADNTFPEKAEAEVDTFVRTETPQSNWKILHDRIFSLNNPQTLPPPLREAIHDVIPHGYNAAYMEKRTYASGAVSHRILIGDTYYYLSQKLVNNRVRFLMATRSSSRIRNRKARSTAV